MKYLSVKKLRINILLLYLQNHYLNIVMLTKFKVSNFKCFEGEVVFDLSSTNGYTFNSECIKDGIVNNAMIYGYNGSGKSNLGWAIFDIIEHLTDKTRLEFPYKHYTNAFSDSNVASFTYEFLIDKKKIRYEYKKSDYKTIVSEILWIDDILMVSYDRQKDESFTTKFRGAENLKGFIFDTQLSVLKYIKNNTVLEDNAENRAFRDFFVFVEQMLFFRSLEDRSYIGQDVKTVSLAADIIRKNNFGG